MFRTTKQEWERTKAYLVRSLFEDVPDLSPINESPEPSSIAPDENSNGYESPLPDLIIEKEVKKSYDEPKEFYDKLAREMRRLYKRDFLNKFDDSSSSLGSSEVDNEQNFQNDANENEITGIDKSSERQSLKETTLLVKRGGESFDVPSEDGEEECRSSVSSDYEECFRCESVTTKAIVHTLADKEVIEYSHKITVSKECDTTESPVAIGSNREEDIVHGIDIIEEEQDEEEEEKEEEDLAKCTEASEASTNTSTMAQEEESPELMRQRQTSAYDSLIIDELPICENSDKSIGGNVAMDEESIMLSEKSIASSESGREMDISEISSINLDTNFTVTSTPKSSYNIVHKSKIIKRSRKRSIIPYSSLSSGIKTTRSVQLQTSFSDDEPEFTYISWQNIVVGTPTVYNVCYCGKHVCD